MMVSLGDVSSIRLIHNTQGAVRSFCPYSWLIRRDGESNLTQMLMSQFSF